MSIERAQLDHQLNELPDSARWASRPELQDLAGMMNGSERALTGGTAWLIEAGKLAVKTWVVICTTERLICLLKGGATGIRKLELNIGEMKSAYTDARLGYHEVIVESSVGKTILSGMPKDSAIALSGALSAQIAMRLESARVTTAQPGEITQTVLANAPAPAPNPIASAPDVGTEITLSDLAACVEKVQRLETAMLQAQKRLAAIEDVIRRAAARSSSPGNSAT